MDNCIFCKILKGEIPCYKIYEDEETLAFLDIHPEGNGHTLVIPKKHYHDYEDIPLEVLNSIQVAGKKIFELLNDKLHPHGIRLVQNNGIIQEVKHYHLHFVPVYETEISKDVSEIYEILK